MLNFSKQGAGRFLLFIFMASGFSGLIYQSIWTQYLGLLLGHSAYAQMLVLMLFMGGMALGAWLVSRRSELLKKPLALYAAIELIIGVLGVGFHSYYQVISSWSYASFFPMFSSGAALEIGRWGVASMLILPQCVLLGATFPLMSAGYIRWQPASGGRVLAGLYFSNSLGAVAGVLASTYFFLPAAGLPGTVLAAGVINILVAIMVWPMTKFEAPHLEATEKSSKSSKGVKFIILVSALTGASSFAYEIIWVRMLSMVLGSTIHSFELMLAAFIAGIALGGLWLRSRADRLSSPQAAAGFAQVAMGCAAMSTLFLYNYSFEWVAWLFQVLDQRADSSYTLYNVASATISMVIMLPTAFFAGMTLPLLTLTLIRQGLGEKAIGWVYAANTLGTIAGVVLAVLFGLPFLGLRLSLWSAAVVDIILGVALLAIAYRAGALSRRLLQCAFAVSVCVAFIGISMSHFDAQSMVSSVFRVGVISKDREIVFQKDGRTASVMVFDGPGVRAIMTNGKTDAAVENGDGAFHDEATMTMLGYLPMFYDPAAKKIGIIGFGSGMSTHFVLGNSGVEEVDTIEIEPAMVEAARHFGNKVRRAYEDQRSNIVIDDAKSYFSANKKKYDVIISEPSNPWVSGVAALFSEEFYRFIPQHLTENGLFVQWLQIYEITPELVSSVLRSMLPHFKDVQVYQGAAADLVMVASPRKGLAPVPAMAGKVGGDIAQIGVENDEDMAALYLGNMEVLKAVALMSPRSPINSDFFPVLQLGAPKARFMQSQDMLLQEIKNAPWPLLEVFTGVPPPALEYVGNDKIKQVSNYVHSVANARKIRSYLIQKKQENEFPPLREMLMVDGLRDKICTRASDEILQGYLLEELTTLATQTVPYLLPTDLKGVWIAPAWLGCSAPENELLRNYMAFLEAFAARNYEGMLKIGDELLKDGKIQEEVMTLDYILGGMELASFVAGEYKAVEELERTHGKKAGQNKIRGFIVQMAKGRSL